MDKYIGFDIDSKKTVACVVQNGKKEQYKTIGPDIESMKKYLRQQRTEDCRIHLCNLLDELELLSIMRAMMMTGELFNEELVCRECGFVEIKRTA